MPLTTLESRQLAALIINAVPDQSYVRIRPARAVRETPRQADWMRDQIDAMQVSASTPKGVRPLCFSLKGWETYQARFAPIVMGHGVTPPTHCCAECTPERQAEMLKGGRCGYPEVVFVKKAGDVVGLRASDAGWFAALTGKYINSGKPAAFNALGAVTPESLEGR